MVKFTYLPDDRIGRIAGVFPLRPEFPRSSLSIPLLKHSPVSSRYGQKRRLDKKAVDIIDAHAASIPIYSQL
jgi:hypothetical protein